jgi:hypothetical protein
MKNKTIPFKIIRDVGHNRKEIWDFNELENIHLDDI